MRTAESIISSFTQRTVDGEIISPDEWLLGAQMLVVLIGEEEKKRIVLYSKVAQKKVEFVETGDSVSMAKLKIEATKEYGDLKLQEVFIEQIWEFIRVSKKRAEKSI